MNEIKDVCHKIATTTLPPDIRYYLPQLNPSSATAAAFWYRQIICIVALIVERLQSPLSREFVVDINVVDDVSEGVSALVLCGV